MKKAQISAFLDFETGTQNDDELNYWREAQSQLYRINNPYVGNKRKIIVDIARALKNEDVKYESVFDLFSGSGVVSLFMKLIGKNTLSNDILTSSYYNALAFVYNHDISLTTDEIHFLTHNANPNANNFVGETYAERFTPEEAYFLGNYRANIDNVVYSRLKKYEQNPPEHAIREAIIVEAICIVMVEHYVMDRCFLGGRLNNGQILAKLEHRLEHNRNKGESMKFRLKPLPLFPRHNASQSNLCVNRDVLIAIRDADYTSGLGVYDLAYIDPPYGGDQSDYASMFAFCEEYIYSGSLDRLNHLKAASKFSKSKGYEEHFRAVLEKITKIPCWAISYNASSFSDVEHIVSIVRDFKKDVIVKNIDHEYKYRKDRGLSVEHLLIAR